MTIGLTAAFLGGVLALLSPCGALLIPAFFAFTVSGGSKLVGRAAMFFIGLLTILLPMGAGAGFIGALLTAHRTTLIMVASVLLIIFGLLQIFGLGFDGRHRRFGNHIVFRLGGDGEERRSEFVLHLDGLVPLLRPERFEPVAEDDLVHASDDGRVPGSVVASFHGGVVVGRGRRC